MLLDEVARRLEAECVKATARFEEVAVVLQEDPTTPEHLVRLQAYVERT